MVRALAIELVFRCGVPCLTGLTSGVLAGALSTLIKYLSGALESEASAYGFTHIAAIVISILFFGVAGVVYAAIFRRAANDLRGGWLFGSSYGFLIWMLGPVAIWQLATGRPLATGLAALGLYGAQVVYGLALGGSFPYINRLVQSRMR